MSKFKYYEIVRIVSNDVDLSEIKESTGIILGMAQDDDGVWGYTVGFDEEAWDLDEDELESTGKFSDRSAIYSGETIRVTVNEKGEGKIKE